MSVTIVENCPKCGEALRSVPLIANIDEKNFELGYKNVCNKCGYEKYEPIKSAITTSSDDDFEDDFISEYETRSLKFIWGVKSYDDITSVDANLYTMNDIDLIYFKDENKYSLGIETIYEFEKEEYKLNYLRDCLDAFTVFMKENGYDTETKPFWIDVFTYGWNMNTHFDSIEDCYATFKMLVNGYCSLYIACIKR